MVLCFSGGRRKWMNLFGWLSGNRTQRSFVASWKRLRRRSVRSLWTASKANPSHPLQTLGHFDHVALWPAETHEATHEYHPNTINQRPVTEYFLTERLANAQCTLNIWGQRRSGLYIANSKSQNTRSLNPRQGHRVWVWALVKQIFPAPQPGRDG